MAPYSATVWVTGDVITAAKANNWETQYGYGSSELTTHKGTTDIDHPAGSVGDTAIGSRTITDGSTATGNTAALTDFLGWLANKAKVVQGTTAWTDAPALTLADASSHIAATTLAHGGLTPATHVGAGGAEHAAATTAAAGFMPAAVMARLAGPGLYDAAFPITALLRCDSSGILTGAAGSTYLYRYTIATKTATQHTHGFSSAPLDVVCDSTYLYAFSHTSSAYGLRRIHLTSSSQTALVALVDGALTPNGGLVACWNGGNYIYALASFQTAASSHYDRLHRYNIVSSSWFFCEEPGAANADTWYPMGICRAADGIIRYAHYHGTAAPQYRAWSEATTAPLGTQAFYAGAGNDCPRYPSGAGDAVVFGGLATSSGGDIIDRLAWLNTASSEWHMISVPESIVAGGMYWNRFALSEGCLYWFNSTGGYLYFWQISS